MYIYNISVYIIDIHIYIYINICKKDIYNK